MPAQRVDRQGIFYVVPADDSGFDASIRPAAVTGFEESSALAVLEVDGLPIRARAVAVRNALTI